jgi:hypothetical protein
MKGPFQILSKPSDSHDMQYPEESKLRNKRNEEIIKPKERLCVMGALMH